MYHYRLLKLQREGKPIRVGWVGAGDFGFGTQVRAHQIPGLYPAIIADLRLDAARRSFLSAGVPSKRIVAIESLSAANEAIRRGQSVICEDWTIVTQAEIDAVVKVTGVPDAAAYAAEGAIRQGKHVRAKVAIPVGTEITYDMVKRRRGSLLWELRQEQDTR